MSPDLSLKKALKYDAEDAIRAYRSAFFHSEEDLIYLDGNSLGRLPKQTTSLLHEEISNAWGTRLIRSWNEEWIGLPQRLGGKLANLIGAAPNEVLFADATSVNLFKLAHAAMKAQYPRQEIISDTLNFPSDLYILQGVLDQFPGAPSLQLVSSSNDIDISLNEIRKKISQKTALLSLSLVTYKSAYLYPMKEITAAAHDAGALVLWDLSHAAGAVEIDLHDAGVDLAVGCSYKYLNGGPGAPAFLYVSQRLQQSLESPLKGWFGDARPFAFESDYIPAEGIQRFSVGTPPILSLAAIEPGLDLLNKVGMSAIRLKSQNLQSYLLELFNHRLEDLGFTLGSPIDPERRGSHVSLQHSFAGQICQALIDPGEGQSVIIPDYRAPNSIRLGLTPLYTSFQDIWTAVDRMVQIMETKEYLKFPEKPVGVT